VLHAGLEKPGSIVIDEKIGALPADLSSSAALFSDQTPSIV
jgi:hypothetical protein